VEDHTHRSQRKFLEKIFEHGHVCTQIVSGLIGSSTLGPGFSSPAR